ncbi:hypothetical protein LguiA_013327 [Lonicera macranthoides]
MELDQTEQLAMVTGRPRVQTRPSDIMAMLLGSKRLWLSTKENRSRETRLIGSCTNIGLVTLRFTQEGTQMT